MDNDYLNHTHSAASLISWLENQVWSSEMKKCFHENDEHHAEEDVFTHICMVIEEMALLLDAGSFTKEKHADLMMAAALHDIAKPATRKKEDKVSFPFHGPVGARKARSVLQTLNIPVLRRENICGMIHKHLKPFHCLKANRPEHEVIRLSWQVCMQDLHILATADSKGRIAANPQGYRDSLELWQILSEEQNCYLQPYSFESMESRRLFMSGKDQALYYADKEMDINFNVWMMAGLPGAGKDTWIMENCPDIPVISLDTIRKKLKIRQGDNQGQVFQMAKESCRELLRKKQNFIFNATNLTREIRMRWLSLFHDYGALSKIIYIERHLDEILKDNAKRENPVPTSVIKKLFSKLDYPGYDESTFIEFCVY